MSDTPELSFPLPTEQDTARLGEWLARLVSAGDTLLLEGPIGAGKTHLARALIRARVGRDEDVPSPSFTLVQTYETAQGDIWHADLYRLTHPDEVMELGLEQAFETSVCLVEWPDRLGPSTPRDALHIRLIPKDEGRDVFIRGPERLLAPLRSAWARPAALADFLDRAGWGAAERAFLAGDASDRRYERLTLGTSTTVLMDAPPGKGDDPADFLAIAVHLRKLGLSAPEMLAADLDQGFLLLEDLGDDLFARKIGADPALEAPLSMAATEVLVHLQGAPAPPGLPDLSAADWAEAAAFALDWYRYAATGARIDTGPFRAILTDALLAHANGPRVLILRDFHAENLLWLPERQGLARVGLLDFQLAQMGQPGYDLVSLLQDARRDVAPATARAATLRFADATGQDEGTLAAALAVLGAQRALRILGVFARLCLVSGKPGYLPMIPRVWAHLQTNLAHPALAALSLLCQTQLPEPTTALLQRIKDQCPTPPKR
jgi:N-acetylmuramate 1-kinase